MRGLLRMKIIRAINYIRFLIRYPKDLVKYNKISRSTRIKGKSFVYSSVIGKYCYIGPMCVFNYVKIGNYCSIAPSVQIGGMEHSWWWGSTSTHLSTLGIEDKQTVIMDDVWIGAGAIIKQGIKIGRGAIIGAGAIVLEDVEPYSIVFGTPAKHIRYRFSENITAELEKSRYWKEKPSTAKKILEQIDYS